jgi:hypothetical protein
MPIQEKSATSGRRLEHQTLMTAGILASSPTPLPLAKLVLRIIWLCISSPDEAADTTTHTALGGVVRLAVTGLAQGFLKQHENAMQGAATREQLFGCHQE